MLQTAELIARKPVQDQSDLSQTLVGCNTALDGIRIPIEIPRMHVTVLTDADRMILL